MSWGERSCKNSGKCKRLDVSFETCNVDCPDYVWDEVTKPDSEPGGCRVFEFKKCECDTAPRNRAEKREAGMRKKKVRRLR